MNAAQVSSSVQSSNDIAAVVATPKAQNNVSSAKNTNNGKNFSDILGKAQKQASSNDQTQDTDKPDKSDKIKAADDVNPQLEGQTSTNLLAEQAVLMVNIASLPNMQILAEGNVADLSQTNAKGITNVGAMSAADFSKLLQTNLQAQGTTTTSLKQLLPQTTEDQTSNQDIMNMLNDKTVRNMATTLQGNQSGAVVLNSKNVTSAMGQTQNLLALSNPANNAQELQNQSTQNILSGQIVTAIDDTQKTANQAMLNAVTGKTTDSANTPFLNTLLMETVSKTAGNNPVGVKSGTKGLALSGSTSDVDNSVIGIKPDQISVNPLKAVVIDSAQAKQNIPIETSILDKPVEKISSIVDTNISSDKQQQVPDAQTAKTSSQFGQMVLNSLNTTSTAVAHTAGTVADTTQQLAKYDIPGQIVEQAHLIKTTEDTQMVIKLSPEHLGDLTLKVSVANGGGVTASFHSDNAQVRTMLENSLIQLKQELEAKGMKVDNVEVYAGLGDFMSNGQNNQTNSQQQNTHLKNQTVDLADFENEVDSIGAMNADSMTDTEIDYKI